MASERISSSVTTPPALRMTCASPTSRPRMAWTSSRASMQATTATPLAGGSGRSPLSKPSAYVSLLRSSSSVTLMGPNIAPALDSAADARADRVPLARRGRGDQAEADRRVRRPGEHRRGAPQRGAHALAGRLGGARPAARLRRVHARPLRGPARRARGGRARGAARAGRALPGRGVGALLHSGGRGVRRGLPARVLAGHRPPRRPVIGKAIGVVVHPRRDSTELIGCVVRWAERHGCEVRGLHEARDLLPDSVTTVDEAELGRAGSLALCAGGG